MASTGGGARSAGVAFVDLAVGNTSVLVEGITHVGQIAAEQFMQTFLKSFNPEGISAELQAALLSASKKAAEETVASVNKTLQQEKISPAAIIDEQAVTAEATKAGDAAGKAMANSTEKAAKASGEKVKSIWSEIGTGLTYTVGAWGLGYAIGNSIYQGISGALSAAKSAIFDFNSELEQAQNSFTTLLGSSSGASALIDELKQFSLVTPFTFGPLVADAQRLMALGIPVSNVLQDLTAIGDAVSAMGGDSSMLEQTVTAFGEMAAKGQIMQVNLRQLEIRGIPALEILANEYGVTTDQMLGMIRAGKILADDALPKLADGIENGTKTTVAFGGQMQQQSKTFMGAISNIQDGLTEFAASAFKPIFTQTEKLASSFANALSDPQAREGLAHQVALGTQQFIDFGSAGVSAGKAIFGALSPVVGLVGNIASALGPVGTLLVGLEVMMGRQINAAGTSAADGVKKFWQNLQAARQEMAAATLAGGNLVAKQRELIGSSGSLAGTLGGVYGAMEAGTLSGGRFGAALAGAKVAGTALQVGLSSLSSFLGGPLGIAMIGITALAAAHSNAMAQEKQKADSLAASLGALHTALVTSKGDINTQGVADAINSNPDLQNAILHTERYNVSQRQLADSLYNSADAQQIVRDRIMGHIDALNEVQKNQILKGAPQKDIQATQNEIKANASLLDALTAQWAKLDAQKAVDTALNQANAGSAAGLTASQTTVYDALVKVADASTSAADKAKILKDAQDALKGATMSAHDAEMAQVKAYDAMQTQLDKNTSKLWDIHAAKLADREAALANTDAVRASIKASVDEYYANINNGMTVDAATKKYQDEMSAIRDSTAAKGADKKVIDDLITTYGGIPTDPKVMGVQLAGFQTVETQLLTLRRLQSELAGGPAGGKGQSRGGLATGGLVYGPGTGTSDSVPMNLSSGEYVTKAASVAYYGADLLAAINARAIPREALLGAARGATPVFAKPIGPAVVRPAAAPAPSAALAPRGGSAVMVSLAGARMVLQVGDREFEAYVCDISDKNSDRRDSALAQNLLGN